MPKISFTTTSFGKFDKSPLELCKNRGFEIIVNPYGRKVTVEELVELAKDSVGLIAGTESITEEAFSRLPNLKVVSRCGTGLDNVDLNAAKKRGIKVFNTPDAPTLAVAELTVGLILNLLRKVSQMDRFMRNGSWEKLMGNLLQNKKVGIIGFGRIGRKVAELLRAFECELAYTDPFVNDGLLGLCKLSLENILAWADIVSIHVSVDEVIIDENELNAMKKGAWLVNVSRGKVVDEDALFKVLENGYLTGAAIDVFEKEPYNGQLKTLGNVILTPHIGSYAEEARIKMEMRAVENLLEGLGV